MQPWMAHHERRVLRLGGNAAMVRLGVVYRRGGSGLVRALIAIGRATGAVPYVADGFARWSAVDVADLAKLYVRVLGHGGVFNVVEPNPPSLREFSEAAGLLLGLPTVALAVADARPMFGPLADPLTHNLVADATSVRKNLGWAPKSAGMLADIEHGYISLT